ncbi:MAG: diguanylate cyclase [Gammaproteobacteria bacterium]|nr:MAG: diguanylate cyclase [Gammaproteobacteria bacterium]
MAEEQQKPRILAVDDSRVMRRAMSKILSKDYDVVETENGEDAWTILLNDDSIQVVFTDLNMPFLDGYGLLERIRTSDNPLLNETPVIIITGKDDDEEAKQEALDKGANDFITKPFDSIQLQARAKAHVTLKQTTTKLSETSDKLERQATVDETTGLGGQRYFCKVGDEILSYANRHGGQFILTRMDIDDFNNLFLKHGKKVMDKVLHSIGEKLSQLVRQEDTIARIGVSKLALILKETTMDEVLVLTERIREEIQNMAFKLPDNGGVIKLTISAGLYEPELNTTLTFKEIVTETEKHLNDAILAGGNRIISHTTNKAPLIKPIEDINILDLLEKLKENKPDELLPKIDSILYHITPLLKFLADNARNKLQAVLRQISSK